jgi:hypothetical protein
VTGVLTPRKGGGLVQSSIERLMRSNVYFGRPLASFVDRSSPMEGQWSKSSFPEQTFGPRESLNIELQVRGRGQVIWDLRGEFSL